MNNNVAPKDEPPTSAKLILYTTHGDIDVELWARQTPLASRNFVQLCMEGYYDNTIFHRMIPGFMIQGGDPTGTGMGGQSIYNEPFKDEFHQRLKFGRRGLLAMANSGKNTNKSQFFITFGECNHLNKKHTIFGKVVGDTVYNLLSMQSLDTDGNDRPTDPPFIRKIRIVNHPFDDLIPRNQKHQQEKVEQNHEKQEKIKKEKKIQKQQKKKLKNKRRLAFDDDEQIQVEGSKIKSSHDALEDEKLSKKIALTQQQVQKKRLEREEEEKKKKEIIEKINEAQSSARDQSFTQMLQSELQRKRNLSQNHPIKIEDEVLNYRTQYNPQTKRNQIYWGSKPQVIKEEREQEDEEQLIRRARELQQQEYEAIQADELNFKRAKEGSMKQRRKQLVADEKALLSNVERRKYEFLKKSKIEKKEDEMFSKLQKFTSRLLEDKKNDWMCHRLKFHIDSENAFSLDRRNQERVGLNDKTNYQDGLKVEYDKLLMDEDDVDIDELYELTKK